MKTPQTSSLFTRVSDPVTGVPYYVLTKRAAAYQQGFYFVNNSMTRDGRYLWLLTCTPPCFENGTRQLAYIDFEADELVVCYDTLSSSSSPFVDPDTGTVYFTCENVLYKREVGKDKCVQRLAAVARTGSIYKLCTHLTRLSDKKTFFIDGQDQTNNFFFGTLDSETGEYTHWFDNKQCLNHAQINPCDDDLVLFAYEFYTDRETGVNYGIPHDENGTYLRLWLGKPDGTRINIPPRDNYATHEWWSADGKKVYYVNDLGIQRYNIETGEHCCIHPCYPWHAHTTADERLYVYDEKVLDRFGGEWFRGCPAAVRFYNHETEKEITIVTEMPNNGHTPENQNSYHIDPHPRFTENEKYIVFTTSELGGADLAIAIVDELTELTR